MVSPKERDGYELIIIMPLTPTISTNLIPHKAFDLSEI